MEIRPGMYWDIFVLRQRQLTQCVMCVCPDFFFMNLFLNQLGMVQVEGPPRHTGNKNNLSIDNTDQRLKKQYVMKGSVETNKSQGNWDSFVRSGLLCGNIMTCLPASSIG
jgi:hypothetical protein